MKWSTSLISTQDGDRQAISPVIISASRSTDIPAYHTEWFMRRLEKGYVKWINPFNRETQYISFEKTRVIVFWSKNPDPIIPFLYRLDERGIHYYFQFTLNDYQEENLEPHVPKLEQRIATFKKLSDMIGPVRVIWRFDPLILTETLDEERLIAKIRQVGDQISQYTKKLVFSFVDISDYKKVQNNLKRLDFRYRELNLKSMRYLSERISELVRRWGISVATCAEAIDLDEFNIKHNKCIDDELILQIAGNDQAILKFLHVDTDRQQNLLQSDSNNRDILKDTGQRKECGCIISKDIGQYNTCPNLCAYCYANTSEKCVLKNMDAFSNSADTITSIVNSTFPQVHNKRTR